MSGLLLAALLLYTLVLGEVPLRDWDEGTHAQVAREIWQAPPHSLTWLYPTLSGEPYLNKPPLMHWLMALSYRLGGVHEWTARLPGTLLSAFSVPLLYLLSREAVGSRLPALMTALVYLTLLPVVRHGRLAMLDGAVLCFWLIMVWSALRARRDLRACLGLGLGLGLICLTKGLLGLLLLSVVLAFLAWDTPRLLRSGYLWGGLLLGLVPIGAWSVAQWQHYGEQFVQTTILSQSFSRITSGVEGNGGPPWYYLLELLKYTWPWLIFLPRGVSLAWEDRNRSWGKLALVWSALYLLAISVMGTKLPWYILPLEPALALLVGVELSALWRGQHPFQKGGALMLMLGASLLSCLCFYELYTLIAAPGSATDSLALILTLSAAALTLWVGARLLWQQDRQAIPVLLWGMYVSLLLLIGSGFWLWELNEAYPVRPVANLLRQHLPATATAYTSFGSYRPSLYFYSERHVEPHSLEELQRIWQQDAHPFLLLDAPALKRLSLPQADSLGRAVGWVLIERTPKSGQPELEVRQPSEVNRFKIAATGALVPHLPKPA
ncbi:glycosyltransferase family 39 protein [Leptolyngbya sp. FACHB-261]|nr:glycosyltransferase family 39 protein [Leptolyngbya sp. FACHB-261]